MTAKHWIIIAVGTAMAVGSLVKAWNAYESLQSMEASNSMNSMQQQVVSKTCSACGRAVPPSSKQGEYCPYCGTYWSYENQTNAPKEEQGHTEGANRPSGDVMEAVANHYRAMTSPGSSSASEIASSSSGYVLVGAIVLLGVLAAFVMRS